MKELELETDADVDRAVRRLTRRGFLVAGGTAVAGVASYKWLRSRPRDGGLEWPFRRALQTNETLAESYFSSARLSPNFRRSDVTGERTNGHLGLDEHASVDDWKLTILGAAAPVSLTMDDLRAFPRREMVTELRCIEGWSIIVQWAGTRLADVVAKFPPPSPVPYFALETPGRGYYVGLDAASALHPQTLLAYEMNGKPLNWHHGAPVRLAIPVKYGIKNIKRIATIRYTAVRPADFWAERGYDWYAGH
jgi:DMSO/TMAO reductase YedYZ molybdopterin-dependent catalytic subunit